MKGWWGDLNKVMGFFPYKGISVQKIIGGFRAFEKNFLSLEEIDKELEKRYVEVGKNINQKPKL